MPPRSTDIPVAALREAARRPDVADAMHAFYAEADRRIAARSPVCWNKGECCRFGEFGHRLYVTALEVVYYLAVVENPDPAHPAEEAEQADHPAIAGPAVVTEDACPHAREGKCRARRRRPLGCRVFYCDPAAQHWQGPFTEEMLARLRRMHDELGVPYFYADWLSVLRELERTS